MTKLQCICCDKKLEAAYEDVPFQPHHGIMCHSTGNYGSYVFDSIDGSESLFFVICDECVAEKRKCLTVFKKSKKGAEQPIPGERYFKTQGGRKT